MKCASGSHYIGWRLYDDAYMLTIPSVELYIYKTPYILSEYNIKISIHLFPWNVTYLLYFNGMFDFVSQILDIVTYILHTLSIFKFTLIFITHTN